MIFKINYISLIYWFFVLIFISSAVAYNFSVIRGLVNLYSPSNPLSGFANFHDHFVYFSAYSEILEKGIFNVNFSLNYTPVSFLYYVVGLFSPLNFFETSFILNQMALFGFFYYYLKVCRFLFVNKIAVFGVFLIPYYIYVSQLSGKDILYLFIVFSSFYSYLRNNLVFLVLKVVICAVFVRFQVLFLLAFLLIFSFHSLSWGLRFFLVYVFSSIVGAISTSFILGSNPDLGDGIARYLYALNSVGMIGHLLLNPVRVVQYFYSFLDVALFSERLVDYLVSISFPIIVFLPFSIGKFIRPSRELEFLICFLLVILLVPTINLRYFMALIPFFLVVMGSRLRVDPTKTLTKASV